MALLSGLARKGASKVEDHAKNRARWLGEPSTYLRDMAQGKIDKDALLDMAANVGLTAPVKAANLAKFLKGSAVKDVVYHGTTGDFDTFAAGMKKKTSESGFFFSPNPEIASRYAGYDENFPAEKIGSVMPSYLSLRNPKVVDFAGGKLGRGEAIADAIANGHDGAILKNHYDAGGVQDQFVVFSPNQIKSATGNKGTYDPTNPSILAGIGAAAGASALVGQKRKVSQ